tara:strand:- start:113 stop:649 length:537 start_codon:yes stop_codon:yes gene_type:complete
MAKKKSTSKSKKQEKENSLEEPKVLTLEQKQATADKLNKLKGSEVMVLPDDAVVTIPISGQFNKALEGLFFHLMEPLNASEIIQVMGNIKQNFNNIPENQVTNTDRALWAVLTLLSEIHWQADAQGKMEKTEAKVGNAIHSLLQGVDGATEQLATGIQVAKEEMKKKRTPEPPETDLT